MKNGDKGEVRTTPENDRQKIEKIKKIPLGLNKRGNQKKR